ncbi:hypothetical protein ABT270_08115, partial [Streptomyces sp900105245]|uniref:hypothetical protein n=1 Tax=Streptomyces sp. 900105245 TaxID=3154379 RepID=UPI0033301352
MTQSGQGEEPSAQPAREGIVLPSDGGEPLLPGAAAATSASAASSTSCQPSASKRPASSSESTSLRA